MYICKYIYKISSTVVRQSKAEIILILTVHIIKIFETDFSPKPLRNHKTCLCSERNLKLRKTIINLSHS